MEEYDYKRFSSVRQANSPRPSPDCRWVYYISDIGGSPDLWRAGPGCTHEELTFLGDISEPLPVKEGVIFQHDANGSEEFEILMAKPDGSITQILSKKGAIFRLGDVSGGGHIAYSSNVRDRRYFDTYVKTDRGDLLVFETDGTSHPQKFSPRADRLLVTRQNTNLDFSLFSVDLSTDTVTEVLSHEGEEGVFASTGFTEDGEVYGCTNVGSEYLAPFILDASTGRVTRLRVENHDCEEMVVGAGGIVALSWNIDGYSRIDLFKLGSQATKSFDFEGTASDLVFSPDGSELFFTLSTYDSNPNIHSLTLEKPARKLTSASRGHYGWVARPVLESYVSFDGLRIPVFVYTPAAGGKVPSVVYVHGGPESQKRVEYDPMIQLLVNSGYAVLTPNVRGSTGYGKRYTHLDDVERRLDSVKDLASLAEWMKGKEAFDAERVCVMGRSYGGYMVLAALAFFPEYWKCGVEAVGIANLETFLENTSVWRRKLREAEYGSLTEHRDVLRSLSPLNRAESIRAPLLIQHGTNDPRVPISESVELVRVLRAKGLAAELVVFEDEGHATRNIKNRTLWFSKVAHFLERYL